MDDAIAVRRRSADIMEAYALAHLDKNQELAGAGITEAIDRVKSMVGVGAAFAVNCVSSLEEYLAAANNAGVSEDEISSIAKLAVFIKKKAASHVEHLISLPEDQTA